MFEEHGKITRVPKITDKPGNSKPVHDLMKLMEIKGWTRLTV